MSHEMPPVLFDGALIARRLAKRNFAGPDFVSELVLGDLSDRLNAVNRRFARAALVGPDTGYAMPDLKAEKTDRIITHAEPQQNDVEHIALPADDYDLIVSIFDLQIVNDVPGYLVRLRRHLKADGLLIAAALGGRSLSRLRAAWIAADAEHAGGAFARIAPFMDVRDAGALLQRTGYSLPVTDVETHTVRYADPIALMRELKALGAANPMADKPARLVTPAHMASAVAAYPVDPDGRISAELEVVWMSGWAPDESQQKPLDPGSGQVSLAKVLNTKSS